MTTSTTSFKLFQHFLFPYKRRRNRRHRRPSLNDPAQIDRYQQQEQTSSTPPTNIIGIIDKDNMFATITSTAHPSLLKKPKHKSFLLLSRFRSISPSSGDNNSSTSTMVRSQNRLFQLPHELLVHIITLLDLPSILALSSTSSFCHRLCGKSNNYLWHLLYQQSFHMAYNPPASLSSTSRNYHQLFRDRHILGKRWQSGTARSHYLIGHEDSVYCLVWVNQHQVLSGSRDRSIKLWDVDRRECLMTQQQHHQGSVLCMTVALDGSFFISGSSDSTLIHWSLPDMVPQRHLLGHSSGVLDVCLVQDEWIVSSSRDTTVRVWHIKDGRQTHRLIGHQGPVNALEYIKQALVVSASGDATLKLWDVATGQCLRTFSGHKRGLACLRYDPTLSRIISGGQDGKIKIWDLDSSYCLHTMTGHSDLIRTIDTSQGNVVTGSYDRTLRVWNASTGQCLLTFHSGHTSWIFNVLASSSRIISAGQDKRILILDFGYDLKSL